MSLNNTSWVVEREFALVPGLIVIRPKAAQVAARGLAANAVASDLFGQLAELGASGLFAYVEPDYELRAFIEPNESRFSDGTLWALRNVGQNGGRAGADLGVVSAWDLTTGSTNVIVAVIDTGIRHTHVDLASQMWRNPDEIPNNGIDDDRDGYVDNVFGINAITGSGNPIDDNDHGTHVAGTIGAAANNGHPHVGVAWNVRLMGCKFLDANGGVSTIDAIECIEFAVANGARILNNSWGGVDFSQALLDAISRARDRGVLFVAAAGNEGSDNDRLPTYPATHQLDNVLSVAAIDRADNLAAFSNLGLNTVHLGAPGVAIFSTSSGTDTEYKTFSGTSMAAPHVSGVAALVLARFPDISLTELRQRILLGTTPIDSLKSGSLTGGRLNARSALEIAPDNVLEIAISTPAGSRLTAGAAVPVFVTISDLLPVTNAVVTGNVPGRPEIIFSNTGSRRIPPPMMPPTQRCWMFPSTQPA